MNAFLAEFYKIFFGSGIDILHLFEIIFRTSFMYLYTILNVRLMDKRSMGLLTPFEIIIIVALGSAVGDPMFYRDIPLLHGMLVISTVVFIERIISKVSMKNRAFERILNGEPILLIKDGELLEKVIRHQNIPKDELFSILRLKGVKDISDIEYAYLEPSGSISIIKKNSHDGDLLPDKIREHF